MRLLIYVLAICFLLATSCATVDSAQALNRVVQAEIDVTEDWNDLAGTYNFSPGPWSPNQTFEMTYSGLDFESDFYEIWYAIQLRNWTELQGLTLPPVEESDIISVDLAHIAY